MWPNSSLPHNILFSNIHPLDTLLFDAALANAGLLEAVASYLLLQEPRGLSGEGQLQWGISTRFDLLFYLQTINIYYVNNHFYNEQLT